MVLINLQDGSTIEVRRTRDLPVSEWENWVKCERCGLLDRGDRSKLIYGQMCCSVCVEQTQLTVQVARSLGLPYGVVQCSECGDEVEFEDLTRIDGKNVCEDCFDTIIYEKDEEELRQQPVDVSEASEFVED